LIIVDMQFDFLAGGALAVPGADLEMARKIDRIANLFDQVILTADDHPVDHISFNTFAVHCVHDTPGAKLAVNCKGSVLYKARQYDSEEYSAFFDGRRINMIEGSDVYVAGVAGDFCVKATIEDLLRYAQDKRVFAIIDLIKSVNGSTYVDHDPFEGKVRFVTSDQVSKRIEVGQGG